MEIIKINMSKLSITILMIVCLVIFSVITMFPGFFPIRPLEPVFVNSCKAIMKGEVNRYDQTSFMGPGGVPTRNDFIECGVNPAEDADHVCYIAPFEGDLMTSENPMGSETMDECHLCQYGAENVTYDKKVLGKVCRPYEKIWRWKYKSPF